MPLRKKVLYYGLMLLLTLLVLEGMAGRAYYAAYGQGYGRGEAAADSALADISPNFSKLRHPFYGFTGKPDRILNVAPPQQRQADTVVIGLMGGSVAQRVAPFLQEALNRRFAANQLPRRPVVLNLAVVAAKQPQQMMIVANTLLLGGEFDLIVNLDGVNEVVGGEEWNFKNGVFPFLPQWWDKRVGLTRAEVLLAGQVGALRREQARLTAAGETSLLRWSAVFGLAQRWRQERIAAAISQRNRQLAAAATDYSLEKHGPGHWPGRDELFPEAARVWYRGSLLLARLAEVAGADYYHFLQPSQYVPGAKPLSAPERKAAYKPEGGYGAATIKGYPLLRQYNRDLPGQGIHYFDLTGIFVDHPETLYIDDCCHLNDRGNELLAAAMVRRLEPALRRWGGASPPQAVSALAAGRRPAESPSNSLSPSPPAFQVSLQDQGKQLRYVRAGCAPEDIEPEFFLHLIPRDLTDLPRQDQESGFSSRPFRFAEVGGRFAPWQCAAQIRLPEYPIAALRTGQHIPGRGDLWATELTIPPDPGQRRADYAALSAAPPAAQDYFALYAWADRLLYFRETCTDQDTAADFFLHIIPDELTDLPAARRPAGFAHRGFAFDRWGGHFDGKCLAAITLPDYPIKEIRTGQHIPGQGDLWSVELISAPDLDQLRADYAALSTAEPAAQDYFDLYWRDNRLLYLRESCAAADTAANFFLHIVPENPTDLPAERQDAGFAHRDFAFVRQGGHFDGKCLAVVTLPDYPIAAIRTGQYVPGQGDLWSVVLTGER